MYSNQPFLKQNEIKSQQIDLSSVSHVGLCKNSTSYLSVFMNSLNLPRLPFGKTLTSFSRARCAIIIFFFYFKFGLYINDNMGYQTFSNFIDRLTRVVQWLPVIFIFSIAVWSYYAYVFVVCIGKKKSCSLWKSLQRSN